MGVRDVVPTVETVPLLNRGAQTHPRPGRGVPAPPTPEPPRGEVSGRVRSGRSQYPWSDDTTTLCFRCFMTPEPFRTFVLGEDCTRSSRRSCGGRDGPRGRGWRRRSSTPYRCVRTPSPPEAESETTLEDGRWGDGDLRRGWG